MSILPNDFARPRLARATLAGLLVSTTLGCGTLGRAPSGDLATQLRDGDTVRPERVAAALSDTRERMRGAPDEPYWPFRIGEIYAAVDSAGKAEAHLREALGLDPSYAPAVALLSKIYYQEARYDEAVAMLDAFVSQNATVPDALRAALALHLEALGELERAREALAACSGDSREACEAKTFVSLRGDDIQTALVTAEQAVTENPHSAANHNNYGITLLFAGRPTEAREAFLDALELDDKLPGAMYNLAIVETFYFFDHDAGREWFNRYRRYASDDPDDLASVFDTDVTRRSDVGSSR
jgi:tetratricopeptide (TPR) repeat protein